MKRHGTLVIIVASFFDMMAFSLPLRTFSPSAPFMCSALASMFSMLSYSASSLAAVFSPTRVCRVYYPRHLPSGPAYLLPGPLALCPLVAYFRYAHYSTSPFGKMACRCTHFPHYLPVVFIRRYHIPYSLSLQLL